MKNIIPILWNYILVYKVHFSYTRSAVSICKYVTLNNMFTIAHLC